MRRARPHHGDFIQRSVLGILVVASLSAGACAGSEFGVDRDGGHSQPAGREEALFEDTEPGVTDLAGKPVEPLRESGAEAVVLVFTSIDCPISNRYAPRLERLYERFAQRGVDWWMVYPEPTDDAASIRRHLESFESPFDALRDPTHRLVDLTGVRVTPEVAVFGPDRELAYRGRIDDWYVDFGVARAEPTRHDLRDALQALLDGRPVERPVTASVGCFIADPSGSE